MIIEQAETKDTLRKFPLFSELSIAELRIIASITKIKQFRKNELIFLEGETYKGFYIVLKGTIKVFKTGETGKETVLHIVKPLNAFADVPLFEGGNYPVTAQSETESTLMFVPRDEFIQILEKNISMCLKMLSGFAKKMRSLTRKIEELSLKEVINRLAAYLVLEVENAKREALPEPFIKLTISKGTLAAYIGTITETLSRTFHKLEEEDIIRMDGKKIFILDYNRLRNLAK